MVTMRKKNILSIAVLLFVAILNLGASSESLSVQYRELYFWGTIIGIIFFIISFVSIPVGLAIMALSMLFSPEIAIGAMGARSITIRIEDLLIPVLILAWIGHNAAYHQSQVFAKTPLNRPILTLLIFSLVSTFNGYLTGWVAILNGMFYIAKTVEFFCIFYLVLNYVTTEKQVRIFLFFALLTVALLALYTLPQVPSVKIFTEHRITAPFEGHAEPATAGGYLAFFLMIVISLSLYQKQKIRKFFLIILAIMIFIPLLYTLNRTSYAAFLVGIGVVAFLDNRRFVKIFIIAMLIMSPWIAPKSVKERIAFTWEDAKLERRTMGVDYSFQERILSFRRCFWSIRKNPLLGLGVASWEYPDNQYTRTLHELGFIGIGLWLWIYIRLFKIGRWLHLNLEAGTLKGLALGYCAGIIGLLIHAMGSVTFYTVRIMEPFWFLSGLMVALYTIKAREMIDRHENIIRT